MHHRFVIFVLLLLSSLSVLAQTGLSSLENWKKQYPLEKIYFHLDRQEYHGGDTVWFKAYLSHDNLPDTLSTLLFTQVWTSQGKMISEQVWPILFGTSNGQFELPDSAHAGEYLIKAWTSLMVNHTPPNAYQKYFRVHPNRKFSVDRNPSQSNITENYLVVPPAATPPIVRFFPEGGNLVEGVVNTVAFEAMRDFLRPVLGTGLLKDEDGVVLQKFTASTKGRGLLEWTPEAGKKYYIELAEDSSRSQIMLPVASKNGLAMTLLPQGQNFYFELRQGDSDPVFQPAYMVGLMGQEIVFKTTLTSNRKRWQGELNTSELRSGILQITIFNKDEIPLAERLCFVNNKEYRLPINMLEDTISFGAKAANHFRLVLPDTVVGSLSVAVTDATRDKQIFYTDNIINSLLLTDGWTERVPDVFSYLEESNPNAPEELDLLLMTRGWRRYHWSLHSSSAAKKPLQKDPGYISLEGVALLKGTRKPFANKELLVIMGSVAKGQNTFITTTNEIGQFKIDSLLFQGTVRFYFMEPRGKKSQYIEIALTKDTITVPPTNSLANWKEVVLEFKNYSLGYDAKQVERAEGNLLEEVTLEAKRKTPEQIVDERYASGLFSGFATRTLDLVSNEQLITEPTIFDYLVARVPGLSFTADGPDYILYYRQGPSASSLGPIPMTVFLNEVETDPSVIAVIPPNEIALVKVFSTFAGAFGNGAGGAMAIYTKKGSDMSKSVARGDVASYRGFTIRREFYSPDYRSLQASFLKYDNRKTLLWKPNIFVNNINPHIPIRFFNNDEATIFRVRVEGMTLDGKLIYWDQLIRSRKP